MHFKLISFSNYSLYSFTDSFLPALNLKHKKIVGVVTLALLFLASCYVLCRYRLKAKLNETKVQLKDEKDKLNQDRKNSITKKITAISQEIKVADTAKSEFDKKTIDTKLPTETVLDESATEKENFISEKEVLECEMKTPDISSDESSETVVDESEAKKLGDKDLECKKDDIFSDESSDDEEEIVDDHAEYLKSHNMVLVGGELYKISKGVIDNGEFLNGKLNGKGRRVQSKVGIFTGIFENGIFCEGSRFEFLSGTTDVGKFKDDKLHGQGGKRTFPKSMRIEEGEFKDGKLDGQGTRIYGDGGKDEGEYKDGELNGQGKRIFENNETEEGEFKNGQLNGKGKRIYPNNETQEGEFVDGELMEMI